MADKIITIRIDEDLYNELLKRVVNEDRNRHRWNRITVSSKIRDLINDYLKTERSKENV